MDVEASRAIRQAEVGASQTMLVRTQECFGIRPQWLVGDTAYGSAPNLDWLDGHKQTFSEVGAMSAIPPKADIG